MLNKLQLCVEELNECIAFSSMKVYSFILCAWYLKREQRSAQSQRGTPFIFQNVLNLGAMSFVK